MTRHDPAIPKVTADDRFIADDGTLHDSIEEWFDHLDRLRENE